MRILVVIAHYFKRAAEGYRDLRHGNWIDPIGRIAAFNAAMIGLHRHFGTVRHTLAGIDLPFAAEHGSHKLDVVVLTMRDHNLLAEIGIDPASYAIEYYEGEPLRLQFRAQPILRDRLGAYDYYGFIEDDLIVHDPAFFAKLAWFQEHFGPKTLLMPVRFEMSSTGAPAKVIADPVVKEKNRVPFRRPGQLPLLSAEWNGGVQTFELPANPHAGGYFLSSEQLAYWVKQPSFGEIDISWVGPRPSAATLSVGKVFDIYKPAAPDPFFLEIEHHGAKFAMSRSPHGHRYGEPPLIGMVHRALGTKPPTSEKESAHLDEEMRALNQQSASPRRPLKAFLRTLWTRLKRAVRAE